MTPEQFAVFDEYADDPPGALAALDEAERLIGSDPAIARARAKVLYRRKDHAGTLALLRDIAENTALDDAIERAFMLREAGISAAELGEWREAARWFAAARDAAASAEGPEMRPMAIGLRADAAVAAFKAGDVPMALCELARTVEELDELEPDSSTKAAYCHRVVRYTAVWLKDQGTGRDFEVDGKSAAMAPGMCSNPEPQEEIRTLPLAPLVLTWYMLAETEIATGADAGIEAALPSHLPAGTIPTMEMLLRYTRVEAAIRRRDPRALAAALGPWLESLVYLAEHRAELQALNPMKPAYGTIPLTTPEQLSAPATSSAATDAVLAFGIAAALECDSQALLALRDETERALDGKYPGVRTALVLASGLMNDTAEERLASLIRSVAHQHETGPDELFNVGVQFVSFVATSIFKEALAQPLGNWVCTSWINVLRTQRFRLRNPSQTAPAIQAAASAGRDELSAAASVLLTAELATNLRAGAEVRSILQSLVSPAETVPS